MNWNWNKEDHFWITKSKFKALELICESHFKPFLEMKQLADRLCDFLIKEHHITRNTERWMLYKKTAKALNILTEENYWKYMNILYKIELNYGAKRVPVKELL